MPDNTLAGDVETPKAIKSNYHTHNYLCGHAFGTVSDYVAEAVRLGYKEIGVSDHCVPPIGSREPYMTLDTLNTMYLPQFDDAKKVYGDKIGILSAVEIEYFDGFDAYYKTLLRNLDYLVLGQHEYMLGSRRKNSFCDGVSDEDITAYCNSVIRGVKSGYFALIAHPDLIFYRRPIITSGMRAAFEKVVKTAAECGVALELNANGMRWHERRYPTELLFELCKKYDAKAIVSSDCHSPKELYDNFVEWLYRYAVSRGLNVIDKLM